jgi:hypothetical protein
MGIFTADPLEQHSTTVTGPPRANLFFLIDAEYPTFT